ARESVDERDLAEPTPHPVGVDVRRDEIAVVVRIGLEPYEPAFGELSAEPVDEPAAEREREGAAERSARRPRVGAGEDLLGRHVPGHDPAVDELLRATEPARAGDEADVELGAGPSQLESLQAELRQPLRAAVEHAQMHAPAARPLSVFVVEAAEVEEV